MGFYRAGGMIQASCLWRSGVTPPGALRWRYEGFFLKMHEPVWVKWDAGGKLSCASFPVEFVLGANTLWHRRCYRVTECAGSKPAAHGG